MLVDDHTLVRAGLRALLTRLEHVEVVAEAGNGRDALRLAKTAQPDVVLMDISMPELNGLEATDQFQKRFPGMRVIIVSMMTNEEYVQQALRAGARGYLMKDAESQELEMALKAVMRGETYLSPAAAQSTVRLALRQNSEGPILTSRQREVLQLIAEGATTKDIASKLNVSIKTVETHRTQLMERLNLHDIAGLVRYAIKTGVIVPEA
jgi:DNA-binding NarL/FixJ family response regulator